jgi:chromosome segregation ATPase
MPDFNNAPRPSSSAGIRLIPDESDFDRGAPVAEEKDDSNDKIADLQTQIQDLEQRLELQHSEFHRLHKLQEAMGPSSVSLLAEFDRRYSQLQSELASLAAAEENENHSIEEHSHYPSLVSKARAKLTSVTNEASDLENELRRTTAAFKMLTDEESQFRNGVAQSESKSNRRMLTLLILGSRNRH